MAVNLINSNDINVVQSDTDISLETNKTTLNTLIDNRINNYMTYSTTEQRIGTWIDGKPLYRKVFNISNPASNNTNYVDLASYNIDRIIHLYGYYKNSAGIFGIPFTDSTDNYSVMFYNGQYIRGRFAAATLSSITDIKVIIEYTKSTD